MLLEGASADLQKSSHDARRGLADVTEIHRGWRTVVHIPRQSEVRHQWMFGRREVNVAGIPTRRLQLLRLRAEVTR